MENTSEQGGANLHPLRAAGRMVVALSCSALFLLVPFAIVPAIPRIAESFTHHGASDGRFLAQMILIISGLSSIVGAPVVAITAKRFGKRPTVLVMLMLFALSGGVGIFEPVFWLLLVSRAVLGFAGGALGMLGLVLITDYYHGPLRFKLFGIGSTVQLALAIAALLLGGVLVDRFGWGAPFAIYLVLGLVMWIIACFCITEPPVIAAPNAVSQTSGLFKSHMPVYPIYVLTVIFIIGQFTVAIQGPFLLVKMGLTKAATTGMLTAIPSVVAMLSSLFFGYLYAWFSERQLIISAMAVGGAGITALAFASGGADVAAYYILIGLSSGIIMPASATMIVTRAKPETREPALGMVLSVIGLAQFLNPIVTAPITHEFGIKGAFFGVGLMQLVTVIVLIFGAFGRSIPRLEKVKEIIETLPGV